MRHIALILSLGLIFTGPAQSGETYDLIFKSNTLSDIQAGEAISYSRQRLDLAQKPEEQQTQTNLRLEVTSDGQAKLERQVKDRRAAVMSADASVGNPLAMFFLESTVRDVAKLTGGSPFYIRNRFKESLLIERGTNSHNVTIAGQEISLKEVVLVPFEDDKNRARMGPFADLILRFRVSDAVPGWYQSIVAEVPLPGTEAFVYRDQITIESQ